MLKQETTKIEDSNIANYGGKDHQNAKEKKAQAELEYKGAGAVVGVEVWRVENFGVKKLAKELHGTFFKGDAYIILNTYKDTGSEALKYNVHFWLGEACTQDESGTAAYKTVELDDLLGDVPVQYREVQDHESKTFMKIFNGTITLNEGGIDSAFHHVKPTEYGARLMHFKGKGKNIRVRQVPLELASLNAGDVFLLDNGLELIQWNGPESNARERRQALQVVNQLKDDRNGKPSSRILDGDEDDEVFWAKLGGKGPIPPAIPDDAKHAVAAAVPKIFSVSDASGSLEVTQVASGTSEMKYAVLNNDDVFIVDNGLQIYVWVGSGASVKERASAMRTATDYLKKNNRPNHTPISRQISGNESSSFKKVFGVEGSF